MMKKLLSLVLICLLSIPVFANRKIDLFGKWVVKEKSIAPYIPIKGSLEETTGELSLEFLKDLGKVVVTVTDASGKIVHQETVSTDTTPTWSVLLDQTANNGTVSISDGVNYIYGLLNF